MTSSRALLEQFVTQELDASVRAILNRALNEHMCSKSVLLRLFEFNCFDISLDFERGIVTLQDVVLVGESSSLEVSLPEFISVCGLEISLDVGLKGGTH